MKLSLKISLLASVVGVIFVLLVFSNTYKQIVTNEKIHTVDLYQDNLNDLSGSFDLILKKATESISVASIIRKDVLINHLPVLKKRFEVFMKAIPEIHKMSFISLEGRELIVASKKRLFEEGSENSYLNEAIFQIAMEDEIYYSDIYFSEESNEMMLTVSKALTDLTTQEKIGVIKIEVSMEDVQELISNKLINGNGIALLNMNNNQYLYKSSTVDKIENSLKELSKMEEITTIGIDGIKYIVIKKDYSFNRLKMKMIIVNSSKNIFFNTNETFTKNIAILLIIILLLSIAMFIFVSYLLKPLKSLNEEIKRLSKKININEEFLVDNHLNEIEMIKGHFYFFVQLITNERKKLEEYNKNLELEVAKKVEKNKLQEKLLAQQSKMASMGEMLENIAHQWRQPLSVISTSASGLILQKQYKTISEEEEFNRLDNIVKTVQHLSDTITSFRDFFKQDKGKVYCNLKDVCKEALNIIGAKFKNKNIEIITNFNDIKLNTYDSELIQVIMNILNNSHDILENVSYEKIIFIDTYAIDNEAIITIKDTGGGIAEDIIDKIFEPYFTTKFKSHGTGIGLYMSQEIITKSIGGTLNATNEIISYENKYYKGAAFTITIPIVP